MKRFYIGAVALIVLVLVSASTQATPIISYSVVPTNGTIGASQVATVNGKVFSVQSIETTGNIQARLITGGQVARVVQNLTQPFPGTYALDVLITVNDTFATNPKASTDGSQFNQAHDTVSLTGHTLIDHLNDPQGKVDVGWTSLDFANAVPVSASASLDYFGPTTLQAKYHLVFTGTLSNISASTFSADSSLVPEPSSLASLILGLMLIINRRR